jgi:hypothetical protein
MSRGLDRYIKRKEEKEQAVEGQAVEGQAVEGQAVEGQAVEGSSDVGTTTRDWWSILQETVTSMILFPNQLAYTREHILPKSPSITPEELAIKLDASLGVAIVILDKLRKEKR